MLPRSARSFAAPALVLLAATLVVVLWRQGRAPKDDGGLSANGSATAGQTPSQPVAEPEPVLMPVATELSAALNRVESSPEEDLQAVGQMLYFFRQGFGENPVGQNEDVVAALTGQNPGRAAYLPKDSPSIVEGRLVDRWGSPYWFHPVSGQHMEIRSAGPDRELFTPDDLFEP